MEGEEEGIKTLTKEAAVITTMGTMGEGIKTLTKEVVVAIKEGEGTKTLTKEEAVIKVTKILISKAV